MGTNYYVTGAGIAASDNGDPGLHIGKKSYGWAFLFRAHPELGLTSVAQWRAFIGQPGRQIISEYHAVEDADWFFAMSTTRSADSSTIVPSARADVYVDVDAGGCPFLAGEFC